MQLLCTAARIVFTVVCVLHVDVEGAYGPVLSSSENAVSNSGKRGMLVGRIIGPFTRSMMTFPFAFEDLTVQGFAASDFFFDRPK